MQILKFCFRVIPQILTEEPCQHSRRWQKLAIL